MPIFSPSLPLDDALKMQLIRHLQAFTEVGDWKIKNLDGTGWVRIASESEARALCAKISEAGLALSVRCNQEKGKSNWIVICESIDIKALFRQSSAVVKAARLKTDDMAMLRESLSTVDAHLAALPAAADVDDLELACSKHAELKKVTHCVKARLDADISPQTAVIHVGEHHPSIDTIKINQFFSVEERSRVLRRWKLMTLPKYSLALHYKDGQRAYYFVDDLTLIGCLDTLRESALRLNLVEFTLAKGMITALEADGRFKKEVSSWDEAWEEPCEVGLYYDGVNDPMIMDAFNSEVLSFIPESVEGAPLRTLDIGGGKGRLAIKIVQELESLRIPYEYILVEPSWVQLSAASKLLERFNGAGRAPQNVLKNGVGTSSAEVVATTVAPRY